MCCRQVAVFPHRSVAVQVRSIPGTPLQLGAVGTSLNSKLTAPPGPSGLEPNIAPAPWQLSVAVGVPVFDGSVESPHCRSLSGGQVMAGAVVSTKMMCWTQVAVLLHPSVAFQVRSMPGPPAHPGGGPRSGEVDGTRPPPVSVA